MILKHMLMKPKTEALKGQFNELQKEVLPVEVHLPEVCHLKIENLLVLKISRNLIRETLKNGYIKLNGFFWFIMCTSLLRESNLLLRCYLLLLYPKFNDL